MHVMRRLCLMLVTCLCAVAGGKSLAATPAAPGPLKNVAVQPELTPLPPGAIEPRGWLRDWALAARDGITGHLDEYHPTFGLGWKAVAFEAPGAAPQGTGWPLEQCAYWFDGATQLALILHDQALLAKVRKRLDPVIDGVLAATTGTLIWWQPASVVQPGERVRNFNSWAHSHMARTLLALYQGTGDRRILQALVRVYRNFPMPPLEKGFDVTYGLVNLDPMLEVYRLSGDAGVLANARRFVEQPSFSEACRKAWPETLEKFGSGHTVLFSEYARIPALGYLLTGDRAMLDASLDSQSWAERRHLLPCGVPSGEEYLAGIGAFRCIETCDVPAWMHTQAWMMRILGKGAYGDRIERAFFNAGPAPIARDWRTMSYYQSPNRISPTLPGDTPKAPGGKREDGNNFQFSRLGFPKVLCCVGNVNRVVPDYVGNMWMLTRDGGLLAALYGPCAVSTTIKGVAVRVTCETAYPFEETLTLHIDPEHAATFPLVLRVPGWCAAPRIRTGWFFHRVSPDANGLVRIERRWKKGDTIQVRFPMVVRVERGFETPYPQIDYFHRTGSKMPIVHNPYASLSLGPLLFALPIPDKSPGTPEPGAKWRYALHCDGRRAGRDVKVTRRAMPAHWDWPLDAPLMLTVAAKPCDWQPTDLQPLPAGPVAGGEAEKIRLVPYGCTRFRVSMFPVTPRAWAGGPKTQ